MVEKLSSPARQSRGAADSQYRRSLALLNIASDPDTDTFAWSATLRLAERSGPTLYDAAYLELAQRLNLPLATLDQELRTTGSTLGVALLGS